MKSAFDSFEGASCVDHKIQNALKTASKSTFIEKLEKACRGIVNHFRRSTKVCNMLMLWLICCCCWCSGLAVAAATGVDVIPAAAIYF